MYTLFKIVTLDNMYLYRYKYVLSYNEKVIAYITYIPEQISYMVEYIHFKHSSRSKTNKFQRFTFFVHPPASGSLIIDIELGVDCHASYWCGVFLSFDRYKTLLGDILRVSSLKLDYLINPEDILINFQYSRTISQLQFQLLCDETKSRVQSVVPPLEIN